MAQANRVRRRHSAEFKQQVLVECDRSVASVAAVALAHGLNDNLVHKWRRQLLRSAAAGFATRASSRSRSPPTRRS